MVKLKISQLQVHEESKSNSEVKKALIPNGNLQSSDGDLGHHQMDLVPSPRLVFQPPEGSEHVM